MGLDLLVGRTGLVSFGHAAYFGLAAYTLALLSPASEAASLWLTLPAAVAVAAAAALVNGFVVLRTRGVYFIMATLTFAQMLFFLFHDTPIGGGSDGRYINFKPDAGFIDIGDAAHVPLLRPRAPDPRLSLPRPPSSARRSAARSPGSRPTSSEWNRSAFPSRRYKLGSFTIGGAIAGIAGYLFACQYGFVNPEVLSWQQSGNVLLMLILGGLGRLHGGFAGALAFVALKEIFSTLTKHWQLSDGARDHRARPLSPRRARQPAGGDRVAEVLLEARGLRRAFRRPHRRARRRHRPLHRGVLHAVLGPNGAGKSTLINLSVGQRSARRRARST